MSTTPDRNPFRPDTGKQWWECCDEAIHEALRLKKRDTPNESGEKLDNALKQLWFLRSEAQRRGIVYPTELCYFRPKAPSQEEQRQFFEQGFRLQVSPPSQADGTEQQPAEEPLGIGVFVATEPLSYGLKLDLADPPVLSCLLGLSLDGQQNHDAARDLLERNASDALRGWLARALEACGSAAERFFLSSGVMLGAVEPILHRMRIVARDIWTVEPMGWLPWCDAFLVQQPWFQVARGVELPMQRRPDFLVVQKSYDWAMARSTFVEIDGREPHSEREQFTVDRRLDRVLLAHYRIPTFRLSYDEVCRNPAECWAALSTELARMHPEWVAATKRDAREE